MDHNIDNTINVVALISPEWLSVWLLTVQTWWTTVSTTVQGLTDSLVQEWQRPRPEQGNYLLPVIGILIIFWPVLFSLIMFFITASTWVFWLSTSIMLGCLQVVYATYHFLMIAVDIFALSLLKTYAMIRNQILSYVLDSSWWFIAAMKTPSSTSRKRQRRLWKVAMEQAGTYENFLKIRIHPKDESRMQCTKAVVDTALPPSTLLQQPCIQPQAQGQQSRKAGIARSLSFLEQSTATTATTVTNLPRRRHSAGILKNYSATNESSSTLGPAGLDTSHLDPRVVEELGAKTAHLLVTTTERLEQARVAVQDEPTDDNLNYLKYILSSVIKRNHLNLDDFLVENSRSVAWSGQYGLTAQTRQLIRAYYEQVEQGLSWLAESPLVQSVNHSTSIPNNLSLLSEHSEEMESETPERLKAQPSPPADTSQVFRGLNTKGSSLDDKGSESIMDRVIFVRKMKQNMGRTALMLSGGGAQAMYHAGLIKALIESKVYDAIKVISGTSGGSITAAMCAIKTPEELVKYVCVKEVSTDFMFNGEMKRQNIRWFPTPFEMASYWLKRKLLVDSAEFRRTCEFYYGSITFEEAFQKTGKHVCITVSASRASGSSAQRLLLNHISTPHVTIASAVAASCALPGVMAPTKLISKNNNGILEPFEVDGVEWIDGSVQADLPFQRISTLFAVSSFIVSQTNFHVIPFLNKAHHPSQKSVYWRLFQTIEWDIRSRVLKLSRLGLFPQFFGQDVSKVFKQRYHGNLTIVPQFTPMQTLGLKVLANPSVKEMEGYLKYGQIAAWPHLNAIRDMMRLERALDDCLYRLEERLRASHGDNEWSFQDDVDSIASSSALCTSGSGKVRIIGRPAISRDDSSVLVHKISHLEDENLRLKQQLNEMKKLLEKQGINGANGFEQELCSGMSIPGSTSNGECREKSSLSDGAEGHLWQMILSKMTQVNRKEQS